MFIFLKEIFPIVELSFERHISVSLLRAVAEL